MLHFVGVVLALVVVSDVGREIGVATCGCLETTMDVALG